MARVALIAAVTLAFFFIQLASSQNTPSAACQDAARAFTDNFQQCTPTTDNPFLICDPPCRGYYEDFINECSDVPEVAEARQVFNTACVNRPGIAQPTSGTTQPSESVLKGLGIYNLLLVSLAASVIF